MIPADGHFNFTARITELEAELRELQEANRGLKLKVDNFRDGLNRRDEAVRELQEALHEAHREVVFQMRFQMLLQRVVSGAETAVIDTKLERDIVVALAASSEEPG